MTGFVKSGRVSGLRDRHAVVVGGIRNERPAVVLAGFDQVEFVTALWAVLEFPQLAVGRERQAVRCAMTGAPRFRRCEVWPRERVGAHDGRGLRLLGVARWIDHGNQVAAPILPASRVAWRRFAVERMAAEFYRAVDRDPGRAFMRRVVADGQKQILFVRRECDCRAELSATPTLAVAPDHLESVEARCGIADRKLGPSQRQTRPTGLARL